jgi:hypothetical protein
VGWSALLGCHAATTAHVTSAATLVLSGHPPTAALEPLLLLSPWLPASWVDGAAGGVTKTQSPSLKPNSNRTWTGKWHVPSAQPPLPPLPPPLPSLSLSSPLLPPFRLLLLPKTSTDANTPGAAVATGPGSGDSDGSGGA